MAKSLLKTSFLLAALLLLQPLEGMAAPTKKKSSKASSSKKVSKAKAKAAPKKEPEPEPELAPGELALKGDAAIVIAGYDAVPIYEKDADTRLYPASTTKIMTALLVIEEGNLEHDVVVTAEDAAVGESGLNIREGDTFSRRDALFGLMIKSANDVAHALARDNAGSVEAFAKKMTARAKELGATNTNFMNPHGLHHKEHYTTARDLALITRAAMQQPFFREIVGTLERPFVTQSGVRDLMSRNKIVRNFPGGTGVKTGFTNPAQHTLASAAIWGTCEMIAVTLHSTKQGKWDDCETLLTHAFMEHSTAPAQATGESAGEIRTTAVR